MCTWLLSGNGMIEAHTPRIIDGWISQCVCVLQYWRSSSARSALGRIAIIHESSSCVSMNSTTPELSSSDHLFRRGSQIVYIGIVYCVSIYSNTEYEYLLAIKWV